MRIVIDFDAVKIVTQKTMMWIVCISVTQKIVLRVGRFGNPARSPIPPDNLVDLTVTKGKRRRAIHSKSGESLLV